VTFDELRAFTLRTIIRFVWCRSSNRSAVQLGIRIQRRRSVGPKRIWTVAMPLDISGAKHVCTGLGA